MREFKTKAELIANYREVRARMRALKPPPSSLPPPLPAWTTPRIVAIGASMPNVMPINAAKTTRVMILYAIVRTIEQNYGIDHGTLRHTQRIAKIVEPRQMACYLLRELGKATYKKIGMILARDHTTVLHGISRTSERMQNDSEFAARVATISEQIRERARDAL